MPATETNAPRLETPEPVPMSDPGATIWRWRWKRRCPGIWGGCTGWATSWLTFRRGRLSAPTPCAEFDVRSLSGHLLGTAERSLGAAQGRATREIPPVITNVSDAMLARRFRRLVEHIGPAWSAIQANEPITAPWGRYPAIDVVRGFTIETLVHGWDLAVATGQPSEAPAGLAATVEGFVDQVIPQATRKRMYDEPGASADHAEPTERLANALGRESPV